MFLRIFYIPIILANSIMMHPPHLHIDAALIVLETAVALGLKIMGCPALLICARLPGRLICLANVEVKSGTRQHTHTWRSRWLDCGSVVRMYIQIFQLLLKFPPSVLLTH